MKKSTFANRHHMVDSVVLQLFLWIGGNVPVGEETSETSWTYVNCKAIFCCHQFVLLIFPSHSSLHFPQFCCTKSSNRGWTLLIDIGYQSYPCAWLVLLLCRKKLGNYMNRNVDHCIDFLSEGEIRLHWNRKRNYMFLGLSLLSWA